ncbi:MAG: hypothetical protein PF904_06200 [Kiritimatiellae bacterium]|jgi:hypothetical protein|nr:hypothetical protein [Kiritimatiellia bacterium]
MTKIVKANPTMGLCGPDRLHPSRTGHLIIALELLKAFGAFDNVPFLTIADGKALAVNATVKDLTCSKERISFRYSPRTIPFPADKSYCELAACSTLPDVVNREMVKVVGLPQGEYTLKADGREIASFTAAQLAKGVNIASLATPNQLQAQKLIPLMEAFHGNTMPLRKIAACKMIAKQEKADLNDLASIDKALDAWLERCKKPPAHAYEGRKQAVDIYRQKRDQLPELEKKIADLTAQMYSISKVKEFTLSIEPK